MDKASMWSKRELNNFAKKLEKGLTSGEGGAVYVKTHNYSFNEYENSFIGSEAVTYCVTRTPSLADSREEAVAKLQQLLKQSIIYGLAGSSKFKDEYLLYRFESAIAQKPSNNQITFDDVPGARRQRSHTDDGNEPRSCFTVFCGRQEKESLVTKKGKTIELNLPKVNDMDLDWCDEDGKGQGYKKWKKQKLFHNFPNPTLENLYWEGNREGSIVMSRVYTVGVSVLTALAFLYDMAAISPEADPPVTWENFFFYALAMRLTGGLFMGVFSYLYWIRWPIVWKYRDWSLILFSIFAFGIFMCCSIMAREPGHGWAIMFFMAVHLLCYLGLKQASLLCWALGIIWVFINLIFRLGGFGARGIDSRKYLIKTCKPYTGASGCSDAIANDLEFCCSGKEVLRDSQEKKQNIGQFMISAMYIIAVNVLMTMVAGFLEFSKRKQFLNKSRARLEQCRNDIILFNILPRDIALQLKEGKRTAKKYAADGPERGASVMFVQICDFNRISSILEDRQIVDLLNRIFTYFDEMITYHNEHEQGASLFKVETVAEIYMVAAGLPNPKKGHCDELAALALDIKNSVDIGDLERVLVSEDTEQTMKNVLLKLEGEQIPLQVRIGLNAGDIMAGVVGHKLPRYRLFGDTVNVSSRMESTADPMMIQMTTMFHDRLDTRRFECAERIPRPFVKGRGKMKTYILKSDKKGSSYETPSNRVTKTPTGTISAFNLADFIRGDFRVGSNYETGPTLSPMLSLKVRNTMRRFAQKAKGKKAQKHKKTQSDITGYGTDTPGSPEPEPMTEAEKKKLAIFNDLKNNPDSLHIPRARRMVTAPH